MAPMPWKKEVKNMGHMQTSLNIFDPMAQLLR
jgi:hypothetical protein